MNRNRVAHDGEKCSSQCAGFEHDWKKVMVEGGVTSLGVYLQDDSINKDLDSSLQIEYKVFKRGKLCSST